MKGVATRSYIEDRSDFHDLKLVDEYTCRSEDRFLAIFESYEYLAKVEYLVEEFPSFTEKILDIYEFMERCEAYRTFKDDFRFSRDPKA